MKKKAALILIGALLLGIAAGFLIDRAYVGSYYHRRFKRPRSAAEILEKLNRSLNLNKDQQDKIRPVLEQSHAEFRRLRSELRRNSERILNEAQKRIRAHLTPSQTERYNEIMRRVREERERKRRKLDRKPGPPP